MPSHISPHQPTTLSQVTSPDRPARTSKTPGQRWKLRRNLVIYIVSQHGASQRLLGDVFDLPHSRISAIIKELRTKHQGAGPAAG